MFSFKLLYVLFSLKVTAWMIGLLLGMKIVNPQVASPLQAYEWAPIMFLVAGVIALLNLKWKNHLIYTLASLVFMFLWTYTLFEFGTKNVSFARTLPETALVYMLAYKIQIDKQQFS